MRVCVTLWAFAAAACVGTAFAQPKFTSVSPDWIQRGATLTFTVAGDNLGSVTGLVFSGEAGLSATVVIESNPPPTVTVESASKGIGVATASKRERGKSIKVQITAAPDASLGDREMRGVGANGISEPVNITVGALAETAEAEPNNTVEQAQKISLPTVVNGVINAATEVDSFRFAAKKGEQLVLEVIAQRKGSALDSSLAVLDGTGKELARSEDALGFDSLIEFAAPEDGEFIAQLRDFQYRGTGDYKYRLSIGALPYVDSVFPFGGQRGQPVEIVTVGRNLQGTEKMTLNIAADAPLGRQEIRLNTPRGLSNPIQFDVRDLPEAVEAEPNNDGTNVNPVSIPVMMNGRIGAPKDLDRFRFKAASDGKVVAEVEGRRFGSQLDALLAVYAGDSLVAQNDDVAGADARLEFDVKKDAEYTVTVRDLTGRGGSDFGYRLALRPPSAAAATFTAKFFPDAVRLNRGGRTRVRCEVARVGFDAPVHFNAVDLPAGVSVAPIVVPAGRGEGDLLIFAAADAPRTTVPLRIVATANVGGKEVTRAATAVAPAEATEKVFRQGFLSVLGDAPFTIDALSLATSMDQLQSGTVDVLVNRRAGFAGDVKLTAVGFANGREQITKSLDVKEVIAKADARTAQLKLTATVGSDIGTRAILVRGEANDGGQSVVQFSQPIAVTVGQIPFVLSATPSKISLNTPPAGSTNVDEVELKVRVERRGFTGELPLTLTGLPKGVTVDGTNIAANSSELVMKFLATDKTPAITNGSVSIQAAAMHNDRLYRHKTGGIKVIVSPPPAMEIAATNAVISPQQP